LIVDSKVDVDGLDWAFHNLGDLYADQGKLAEAEAMYIRALQGYKEALGPDCLLSYLPALITMFSFGDLLSRTGRKGIAKNMYTRALSGYRIVQGPSSKWCRELEGRLEGLQVGSVKSEACQIKSIEIGQKPRSLKQKSRDLRGRLNVG
jgi:tetratricopeptide (TPR) repeat protein